MLAVNSELWRFLFNEEVYFEAEIEVNRLMNSLYRFANIMQ
jgi:hypothetical protein